MDFMPMRSMPAALWLAAPASGAGSESAKRRESAEFKKSSNARRQVEDLKRQEQSFDAIC